MADDAHAEDAGDATPKSTQVIMSLGSNMCDSLMIVQKAIEAINQIPHLSIQRASSAYKTKPVDNLDQPDFFNAVVSAVTQLDVFDLLTRCQAIENAFGRVRDPKNPKGPRTLDIDLIKADGIICDTEQLTLPHPRAHLRAFVLVPWKEIETDAALPAGRIDRLLADMDLSGVQKLSDFTFNL